MLNYDNSRAIGGNAFSTLKTASVPPVEAPIAIIIPSFFAAVFGGNTLQFAQLIGT